MLQIKDSAVPVKTLREYLSGEFELSVPQWQREYAWEAHDSGQVGELLTDLRDFVISDSKEYLIGSIILCNVSENQKQRYIIDGQQRTMTFLLFLMCARKFMKTKGIIKPNSDMHNRLATDVRNCLSRSIEDYEPRVSMNQANANKILEEIWHWSNANEGVAEDFFHKADTQTETQKNLVSVTKYIFNSQFENEGWIDKDKFIEAVDKILNCVKFVELTLDTQTEAISVFDHINDRGLSLTSADLIKNRIFQKVNDDDFALISQSWQEMSVTLNKCDIRRLHDPKFLLRALAWTQSSGKKITYDGLTEFWTKYLEDSSNSPSDFAMDLATDAEHLRQYSALSHDIHGYLPELFLAKHLKSVQHYPLLLSIRRFSNEKVFKRAIKQIHNRTAFYVLAQERTQTFESIVPQWATELYGLGADASLEKVDKAYSAKALLTGADFEKLKAEMFSWRYDVPSDRVKIRAVLSHLSWMLDEYLSKNKDSVSEYFRTRKGKKEKFGWDIDHILPSSKAGKQDAYHSIGNLVLLYPQDNRSLQAAEPSKKKTPYLQHPIYLTKTASGLDGLADEDRKKLMKLFTEAGITSFDWNLDSWDEKSVQARAEFYFALLKHDLTSF
jgi:hypothetical protein